MSTHRVVTVDLVGFGTSRRPRSASALQAPAQAEALARVLDDRGLRGATVAGHDFGGPVAAHLAARRPDLVGGLVWLSGNAFPDTPVPFPLSLVTWRPGAAHPGGVPGRLVLARRRAEAGEP